MKTSLAIECSSELCSVALKVDNKVETLEQHAPREHAYMVLPFAERLLYQAGLEFNQLDEVVFGQGPGAFTGLRVAASIAQGLALAYAKPLAGACSLSALAMEGRKLFNVGEGDRICAVLDARMSELYWACFEFRSGELLKVCQSELGAPEKLVSQIQQAHYFLGPGCKYLGELLKPEQCNNLSTLEESCDYFPRALFLFDTISEENTKGAAIPQPVYLRNNVADKPKA